LVSLELYVLRVQKKGINMPAPTLKTSEYMPYALKSAGVTRANHNNLGCTGSSKSMIITTEANGKVKANCFRCGAWGSSGGTGFSRAGSKHITTPPYSIAIPTDKKDWVGFPMEAKAWLMKAGIGDAVCGQYGIVWSDRFDTLVIPIPGEAGKLLGVVHRGFKDHNRYKLLTKDGQDCFLDTAVVKPVSDGEIVVLVEDSLSAIKCREAGFQGVALLGVHLRKGVKRLLVERGSDKVVVWLDNDTSKVRLGARAIKKELPWINVQVVSEETDAKYHTIESIKEIVWKALS
jgi:hypothetical protein